MFKQIVITVNGQLEQLNVDIRKTLLEVLREDLQLTGAKNGCGMGECGACTVLLNGLPVNACLQLALWADGQEIVTVEGLSQQGNLSKVQKAFIEAGAIQCGFCTPGLTITATSMVESGRHYDTDGINRELSGHLCRCTGYQNIRKAVEKALKKEVDFSGVE